MSGRRQITRSHSFAVRMAIVIVLTPLIPVAAVVVLLLFAPGDWKVGAAVALVFALFSSGKAWLQRQPLSGTVLSQHRDPELFAILDRLCAMADLRRPEVVLRGEVQPNSWVIHTPGRKPRLYLTTGLREALTEAELRAVLAHELSQIVNGDAALMTVLTLPARVLLRGLGGSAAGLVVVLAGAVGSIGTAMLSRQREYAADAGSATLTGSASALASALLKLSKGLDGIPAKDLREAAALNPLNLLPVPTRHRRQLPVLSEIGRVFDTHPSVERRVAALHRLERATQQRRGDA